MKTHALILLAATLVLTGCSSTSKKEPGETSVADIYVQKGVQYMESGQLDVALQDLQHAIELDGRNSEAHNAIAVLYGRLDRPGDAETHFKRALSLDSNNASTLNNYGRFLCARGQYDQAMDYYRQAIGSPLYSQPWVALTNAGLCARSSGKKAETEEYLRKALEKNPAFPPALLEMAKLSFENGQFMSARAFLQRYEAVAAPTAEALWIGVQTEQALGNSQAVGDYINTLRSRFPDSREALQARRLQSDY
ncbi:MAG TPA: type IV pilus biogenesis/stability protein PilW [Methylococcaceae bacterium]|jgi:type IV pilus assembly protein PilF|nr:type IV pilus biogenesis/stability protein PilW [Methylococcaceae bacterium]